MILGLKPRYPCVFEKFKVWEDSLFWVRVGPFQKNSKLIFFKDIFILFFLFYFYLFYVKGTSMQKKKMCSNACICFKIHALKN